MKRLSLTVILLLLLVSVIGVVNTGEVKAKDPPVFNTNEIQKDSLKAPVANADLIALGTITDKKYEIVSVGLNTDNVTPGKFAYTIFTLSVEKVIKGNPDAKEVLIKVEGGPIGEVYQLPTSRYFRISDHVLLGLIKQKDDIYTLFETPQYNGEKFIGSDDSVFWIKGSTISTAALQEIMGRIAKIMLAQDIPIVVDEPIPMPAEPVKRPDGVKLPVSYTPELKNSPPFELPESYKSEQEALLAAGWNNLMTENFEGQFPSGSWTVAGNPTWDDDDFKPHYGDWSAWCANGGTGWLDPESSNYPNNMNGWMIYGPFDLSSATAAAVDFYRWNESELNYDYLEWRASADGTWFYGWQLSGDQSSWHSQTFDLSDVPGLGSLLGDSSVWIAFCFTSDSSITYKGAFIDDIVLRANISGPRIDSISPTSGSAGTDTVVTINGQYFGDSQGSSYVLFYWKQQEYVISTVRSWSDTQISVIVPPDTWVTKSASSGPLIVHTDRGNAQRDFTVTFSYQGLKWTGTNTIHVPFEINPNTADCTGEELAVRAAAQTWSNVSGANFVFDDGGLTSTTDATPQPNNHNEIWWGTVSSGDAQTRFWGGNGNLWECDIVFNDNYTWGTSGAQGIMDVQSTATHELGHWLSLMNLYGAADDQKTMYGFGAEGQIFKRTLAPEDIAGIQYIYPGEAPAVTTNAATGITSSSATLNGVLTSLGTSAPVYVSFEWGLTTGYGNTVAGVPPTLSSPGAFNAVLNGLSPNTTYHFRAKAVGDGTSLGSDMSFTTPPDGGGQKLIGTDTPGNGSTGYNKLILCRFQATETGTVNQIRIYSRADGDVKVGIYTDNAGEPDTLLNANSAPTAVIASQWNDIYISPTPVTSSTYYWLAAVGSTNGALSFNTTPGSGTSKGRGVTFSSFVFPKSAGTDFTDYTYERAFAGWEVAAPFTDSRLVGTDTAGDGSTGADRFILGRFQATETGMVNQIRVYSRGNGNVKVAIYSDNAGEPDTLLNSNNTPTYVIASQWNNIYISPIPVTSGAYYWLGAIGNATGAISYNKTSGSGTSKGKNVTFSSFVFPKTIGTLDWIHYTYERAFAGWGITGP